MVDQLISDLFKNAFELCSSCSFGSGHLWIRSKNKREISDARPNFSRAPAKPLPRNRATEREIRNTREMEWYVSRGPLDLSWIPTSRRSWVSILSLALYPDPPIAHGRSIPAAISAGNLFKARLSYGTRLLFITTLVQKCLMTLFR